MNESSCSSLVNPKAEKIGITIVLCCILMASLVGNSFIGIIVYKAKTMQKAINFFIVNVAMSDLLFTIFYIPFVLQICLLTPGLSRVPLDRSCAKLWASYRIFQ